MIFIKTSKNYLYLRTPRRGALITLKTWLSGQSELSLPKCLFLMLKMYKCVYAWRIILRNKIVQNWNEAS